MIEERPFTDFEDLEPPLAAAVQAALSRPTPEDAIARVKARAKQLAASGTLQVGPKAEMSRAAARPAAARRWRRVAIAVAGLAAAVLVAVWFWNARESAAWAQMINAVRAKQWIHAVDQGSPDDKKLRFEIWFSMTKPVVAVREGGRTYYDDGRAGVSLEYDPERKELYRLPPIADEEKDIRAIQTLFSDLFAGREVRGRDIDGQRIVKQQRRRATISGREWLLYSLSLEDSPFRPKHVLVRVDPRTMLPQRVELFDSSSPDASAKPMATFDLDYPETGPADIYTLGVPRSAKVVDCVPTPELARLLQSVDDNRRRFADSYYAIVAETADFGGQSHAWWEVERLTQVWCKGDRWRVEEGHPKKHNPRAPVYAPAERPAAGVDKLAWWKEHLKDFDFQPTSVCDGRAMYAPKRGATGANGTALWEIWRTIPPGQGRLPAAPFGPASTNMPEFRAYPVTLQWPNRDLAAELVPHPADGPAGAVLVKYRDSPDVHRHWGIMEDRFWVDPARSFVTLREDMTVRSGLGARSSFTWNTWLSEEFAQTPGGIWYATVVRWLPTEQLKAPRKQGRVYRFFMDFKADMPDNLFKPGTIAAVKATTPPPPSRGQIDLRDIGIAIARWCGEAGGRLAERRLLGADVRR